MRKALFLIGIGLAVMTLISQNIFSAQDTKSVIPPEGKEYTLTLVSKVKPGLKVLTPAIIQSNPEIIAPFTTYTTGKIEGTDIKLIDDNKDGEYNGVGVDVVVIGDSPYGIPVSNVVSIKNTLYNFTVEPNGQKITLKPYQGEYGVVDMISGFKCPSQLDLAIINCGRDIYLDVAKDKKTKVPCGTYTLWLGYISEASNHVAVRQGRMEPITVTNEAGDSPDQKKTTLVNWGGPCRLEFEGSCDKKEVKKVVTLNVRAIYSSARIFGKSNEEYFGFNPHLAFQIEVTSAKEGKIAGGAMDDHKC
ncbi:MAG: hypothetical protein V1701_08900 [Planctomycetota bacterium]